MPYWFRILLAEDVQRAVRGARGREEATRAGVVGENLTFLLNSMLIAEQPINFTTQVIQQSQNELQMANSAVLQLQQEVHDEKDLRVREQYRLESDVKQRQAERDAFAGQLAQALAQVLDRDQTIVQLQQHASQVSATFRQSSEELENVKLAHQVRVRRAVQFTHSLSHSLSHSLTHSLS